MIDPDAPALEVTGLVKHFPVGGRLLGSASVVHAVEDVSFSLGSGEMLGLVGESGSGKSMTALALLGLVPRPGQVTAGSIWFGGQLANGLYALYQLFGTEGMLQILRGFTEPGEGGEIELQLPN